MTCNPTPLTEIPGSYVTCQILIVRECLSVNGIDVLPGGGTNTDGVTIQGAGTLVSPVAIKAVQHDASMSGNGTVASPLSVAGIPGTTHTDGVTIQGDGSMITPIAILAVQCNPGGIRSIDGAGTVASKLNAVALQGPAGFVDTTQFIGGHNTISITGHDPGNIAVQAQNSGASAGDGNVSVACDGAAGSSVTIGSRTNTANINIGSLVGAAHDNPRMFSFDLRDCGGLANIGVGPAGTARFAYDLATNTVYVSKNGAAFVAVLTA